MMVGIPALGLRAGIFKIIKILHKLKFNLHSEKYLKKRIKERGVYYGMGNLSKEHHRIAKNAPQS